MGSQQTSSTTGTAMIALVRDDYNEVSTTYFGDADILQYINDGCSDIAAKTHCYQTTEDVTLVASTIEYTISATYIDVVAAQYYNGTSWFALKPGKPSLVGLSIQEGDTDAPTFFYEFAGKVGIYPALSTVTTQSAKIYLARKPAAIAVGDTILTPAIYDTPLKLYCYARMALKDKNPALYAATMQQYEKELGFYRTDLQDEE